MIVTDYIAPHHGIEIVRSESLAEVLDFARAHLRGYLVDPPPGTKLRTVVGEHVISIRALGPGGDLLT